MSSSSDDEVVLLASLLADEEEQKKRKCWVHTINKRREEFGEFHHLFPDMRRDKKKFMKYFRMSEEKFFELNELLTPIIQHKDTNFRRAVTCEERLAVCLR